MRIMPVIFAAALAAAPASAEEGEITDGLDLLSEGTQMLLRGLLQEIEPTLREVEPRLRELQPFLSELEGMLPEIHLYELPEVLPNGDIIIRRKQPKPGTGPELGPDGEIEI